MATYTTTHAQITDNVGVIATLTNNPIEVGNTITLSGFTGTLTTLNNTFVVMPSNRNCIKHCQMGNHFT